VSSMDGSFPGDTPLDSGVPAPGYFLFLPDSYVSENSATHLLQRVPLDSFPSEQDFSLRVPERGRVYCHYPS